MRPLPATLALLATCALLAPASFAFEEGKYPPPKPPELKWEDLLSGKLEDHFADMNCAIHSPTFEMKADPDNAKGHMLHLTRRPTGLIRTHKQYENFILECDWRHLTEAPTAAGTEETTGNSGLYVWADPLPTVGGNFTRAIEVQVCNLGNDKWYTSHGDLFPIWGAKMTPDPRFGVSHSRSMPIEFRGHKTGEWNHIRVTCVDGTIQEEVNGAVVSAGFRASPKKGYLCIESEGGPIDFRNMRIHELPGDPKLKAEDVAQVLPEGTETVCLYNGVDLEGAHWNDLHLPYTHPSHGYKRWKIPTEQKMEWVAEDHLLKCEGKTKGVGMEISFPPMPGDFTLQLDWKGSKEVPFALTKLGELSLNPQGSITIKENEWNRATAIYHQDKKQMELLVNDQQIWTAPCQVKSAAECANDLPSSTREPISLRLLNPGHPVSFSNIILIQSPEKK